MTTSCAAPSTVSSPSVINSTLTSDAGYATLSQLLVLFLLVGQMERTRTPSTLAKVSLWTIVLIALSDSWIFSAHLVFGVLSDNRTSLPMLVPGFAALCTAIVFGPVSWRGCTAVNFGH